MTKSSLSDSELWDLIVKDDDYRAFLELFKRNWLKLYKTALYYVKDEAGAEEVVNDLFLNIWNRKSFLVIDDLAKYFKAATRYQAFTYLHKIKSIPLEYTDHLEEDKRYSLNQAQENLMYHDFEYTLTQHLNLLPLRCQEIFILSRMHHLSNHEIAERLGISKRTVENQITHALKYIRFNLKNIAVVVILMAISKS
jgi:RNA polymerase sigma-70 factor (family 1)